MATRLRKIQETLTTLKEIEIKKPGNQVEKKCTKCGKSFTMSVLQVGKLNSCPHCKAVEIYN